LKYDEQLKSALKSRKWCYDWPASWCELNRRWWGYRSLEKRLEKFRSLKKHIINIYHSVLFKIVYLLSNLQNIFYLTIRRYLFYKAKSLVESLADARQLLTTKTIGPCIRPLREYL